MCIDVQDMRMHMRKSRSMDMCVGMRTGMHIGMRMSMGIDICVHVRFGMGIDMCVCMCNDGYKDIGI